ncbi:PHD finger protein 20 isoform X2 [Clupea harengus]|uniref:PHD finger protein 20 isoform X2 n=1 Tax=Clupea harengus TaxID=7950 RepID=A0A6P8FHZ8_CLUHA|nr:PHD finger protein 20 isoform X2 [Clupea harengus]
MLHNRLPVEESSMNKTPPNRRGITFEVGAQLEARDSLKNWYSASIEKIDYDDEKVLIHYRQWSHRYDEWFEWASPYLRPVERIQLRREGLQDEGPTPGRAKPNQLPSSHTGFRVNDKVLASWSDCRFYPATVLAVNKDASYTVRFYDNVVQTVKGIHVKPFIPTGRYKGKPRVMDRNRERSVDGKTQNGRERKPPENRAPKGKKNRPSSSDQDGESNTDEEEDEEQQQQEGPRAHWHQEEREEDMCVGEELSAIALRDEEKPQMEKESSEGKTGLTIGNEDVKINRETEQEVPDQRIGTAEASSLGGDIRDGGMEQKEEGHHKKTREQGTEESWSGKEDGNVSVLRKRRVSVEQASPSKKSKVDNHSEHGLHNGTTLYTETSNQNISAPVSTSTIVASAQPSNDTEVQKAEGQSEVATPPVTAHVDPPVKPIRKQGFHNPNRFSREPLYRVVKNQPPPVLSINLDHNAFKCSAPGCTKSFRKAKLLHYHMKYYHGEEKPLEGELSPSTGGPKPAGEKQVAPAPRDSPKRRRTISASMHSCQHSPSRPPTSPRSEAKAGVLLGEKRRTSAPPTVDIQLQLLQQQHHQRPSLKEKSKENQLERNAHTNLDRDRSPIDIVCLKDREKTKDKKPKDFLRIKLKKKKKKKSKSEYRGSEENIDISVFQHQFSKLGLPHKFPPSLNHKPEAYASRPGHFHTQPRHVDDEDYATDWSTDSCGWSEEEVEAHCGVTDPFLSDDSTVTGTRGSEIVRCVCEAEEDNDFMIQCEECMCWQHGTCMGLLEDNVPEKYTCYICRDPPGQRQSLRYWYDREWLSSGHMYGLSFLKENYSHQNARKITATHQLLGDVQQVLEVLNGLQLKISVLQNQTHPDLHLWCQPWRPADKPIKKEELGSDEGLGSLANGGRGKDAQHRAQSTSSSSSMSSSASSSSSSPLPSPFQDAFISYISSEHCYQKPRALVVEKRGGSYMDGDLHACDPQRPSAKQYADQESDYMRWSPEVKVKKEEEEEEEYPSVRSTTATTTTTTTTSRSSSAQQQQWQANLLDHIESVQDEVCHRMDFIERELDVLESCLDYTGELEPPEPLTRLPQLKHRIKELLSELGKVQQIALSCTA